MSVTRFSPVNGQLDASELVELHGRNLVQDPGRGNTVGLGLSPALNDLAAQPALRRSAGVIYCAEPSERPPLQ